MLPGWRYWGMTAGGTVALSALVTGVVVTGTEPLTGAVLATVAIVTAVFGVVLWPVYAPRPRPMTAVVIRTGSRVGVACLILIALGASGLMHALPLATVIGTGVVLAVVLPAWYWLCQRYTSQGRVLVVGDTPELLETTIRSLPQKPIGFLSPPIETEDGQSVSFDHREVVETHAVADGGAGTVESVDGVNRLSGLSRLPHVLRERNVDTVAVAFVHSDRKECFGVLRACHDAGVDALAHESLDSDVLTDERVGDSLVAIDLEPWPWYSRLAKRGFDIAFASIALLCATPLILLISIAIKLDSPGPILYSQRRTSELGATFRVWKFRSMLPESEDARPGDADDRITRVGRVLRKTHLDEIPQLWSILVGTMSVVGPRAAWTNEEELLMAEVDGWPQRWAITPGLTGLAQIRGIDSTDGQAKLDCDLEYVHRQSLLFDISIVCRQLWQVARDINDIVRTSDTK